MDTQSIPVLLAATVGLFAAGAACADGGRAMPPTVPPAYTQECGSCHLAYPPGLLPARTWQRVMSGLDRHFGADASVEVATARELGAWLAAHAGTYKRVRQEPPQDRITLSDWFLHKHRQVEPAVWQLPSVKSAANCVACHGGAEQGRFDEHALRMPAGLTPRQRRAWTD